jgi:hypothetical protein
MRTALLVCLTVRLLAAQESQSIQGLVVDPAGGVIAGARVEVFSDQNRCKTTSDSVGKFRCDLPAGRYQTVFTSLGFCPYRRATVKLDPKSEKFVEIRTVPCYALALTVTEEGLRDIPIYNKDLPQYEDQVLEDGSDAVVRYGKKERRGNQIEFSGPFLNLTADALDVSAEKMLCSDPIRICTAFGSVVAELGSSEFRDTELTVDLSKRIVVFSREPSISRTF